MQEEQWCYDVMYQSVPIGTILSNGSVSLSGQLPYDLHLEECHDFDARLTNLTNFRSWCASRVVTLDREYAKQILNACALSQFTSEKERCRVGLAYNCLSLRDSYWIWKSKEESWERLNLFENATGNECVDIALKGKNKPARSPYSIAPD